MRFNASMFTDVLCFMTLYDYMAYLMSQILEYVAPLALAYLITWAPCYATI